jgi:hypothetical protein
MMEMTISNSINVKPAERALLRARHRLSEIENVQFM